MSRISSPTAAARVVLSALPYAVPMGARKTAFTPVEHITQFIVVLRGHGGLLDAELALLYGVTAKRLN